MPIRLLILVLAISFSCSENKDSINKSINNAEIKPFFEGESTFENEISKIEHDTQLTEVTSLDYIDSEGKSWIVKAMVDNEMNVRKLTLPRTFTNGDNSILSFYYLGARKFASIEEYSRVRNEIYSKTLTKSFYDDSVQVFFSKKAYQTEDLESEGNFKKTKSIAHSDALALAIINQEGDFQTKFQGFIENLGKTYLIVGTDKYSSTLAFSEYSGLLKQLKANEKKYIGQKLKVQFTTSTEANGFTFQVLTDLSLAK